MKSIIQACLAVRDTLLHKRRSGTAYRLRQLSNHQSKLLQATLENMDQGVMMIDADGIVQVYNSKVLELLDLPEELLARRPSFLEVRQYQLRQGEFEKSDEAFRQWVGQSGLENKHHTYERERENGTVLEIRTVPLPTGGAVRTYTDITARRNAEAGLRVSEERYRLLAENATDIISRTDLHGYRTYISPVCRDILGFEPEELIGTRPIESVHPDDQPAVAAGLETLVSGVAEVETITYRVPHKDGHWVWLEARRRLVRDREGSPCEIISILRDITERRALEDQLRQAQKMEAVGQLTGGVAHDFNNLLTVIVGNSELIIDETEDHQLKPLAMMIMEAAERGAALTQQLLAFGRRQSLKPEPLVVSEVVTDMLSLLGRTLGEHIQIRTEIGQRQLTALADRAFLESAILNLVVNARDAMPQGGTLTISAGERAASRGDGNLPLGQPVVFITVSDNGTGISPEVLERVFEPFFTTKSVGEGTGLGLSMVYGFAEQSGGHVAIKSTEGEGTSVTILLRAVQHKSPERLVEQAPSPPTRGRERVLVVEDEPQVLKFVSSQLQSLGYQVTGVTSGPDALAALDRDPSFDLLFTDVVLPHGMSGVELARRVQEKGIETKVLLTSGYSEEVFVLHGRPDTNTLLLRKPYRRKDLAETLRKALAA